MQGKVSMVMPCYNKVQYIGEMFDSIIAQEWDSIELILVNDGSTDGTREVIIEYEPKFRVRGYEVVIIDQENHGVCAAAKAGLERVSGEYVCMVDADDELDPKYVSTMAGWLEDHSEYDYCMCGNQYFTGYKDNREYSAIFLPQISDQNIVVEDYLIGNIWWSIWAYMVRAAYFLRCHITETYIVDTRGSHEPSFMIPLTANGGKIKIFSLALYHHNRGIEDAHSQHHTFEKMLRHLDEYFSLVKKAVNLLPNDVADSLRKQELNNTIIFSRLYQAYHVAIGFEEKEYIESLFNAILTFINDFFSVVPVITREQTKESEFFFLQAVKDAFRGRKPQNMETPCGRVIGYGVFGRAAARLLPLLKGTTLEPTELWDVSGDGTEVKKPAFETLSERDIVLVFPIGKAENDLRLELDCLSCRTLYNNAIRTYLVDLFLIRLYEQKIRMY